MFSLLFLCRKKFEDHRLLVIHIYQVASNVNISCSMRYVTHNFTVLKQYKLFLLAQDALDAEGLQSALNLKLLTSRRKTTRV